MASSLPSQVPAPAPSGARIPWGFVALALVIIILAGVGIYILIEPLLGSEDEEETPKPTINVVYESNAEFSQRNCRKYNVTITLSTELANVEFTIHVVLFTYIYDGVTNHEVVSEDASVRLGVEATVTIQIDSCKGVERFDTEVCAEFQAQVSTSYAFEMDSRMDSSTQTFTVAGFKICG